MTCCYRSNNFGWTPDGPALNSILYYPSDITTGPPSGTMSYDVYWTEPGSGIVRRYNGANVTTVAGTPRGFGMANGPALSAKFAANSPTGLAFFGNDLFIVDNGEVSLRLDAC